MEEKWTHFVESSERDVKKQISNTSQNTKMSTKFAVNMQYEN